MLFLFAFSLLLCLIFVLAHFAIKLWQWSQHWKQLKVIYVPLEVPWPWSIFKSGSDQVSRLIEVSNMVPHKYFGTFLNQSPILVLNDLDMIEEVLMDNCGHFLIRNAQIGSQVLLSPGQLEILTPLIDEMTFQLNEDLLKHVANHSFVVERSIKKIWRQMLTLSIFGRPFQEQESDFRWFQKISKTYAYQIKSGKPNAKDEYNRCCHAFATRQLEQWSQDEKRIPDFVQFMLRFMNTSSPIQVVENLSNKIQEVREENEKNLDLRFVVGLAIDIFSFGLDLFMECVHDCLCYLAQDQELQTKIQIEIDGIYADLWDSQKCPNFEDLEGMQAIEHIIEDVFLHNFKEHMLIRHTAKDFKFQQDQLIIPKGQEVHIPLSMAQQAFSTENADKMFPSISRHLDPLSVALLKMTKATLMIVCRQFRFHPRKVEDVQSIEGETLRAELRMTPRSRKRKIGVVSSPILKSSTY